MNDEYSVIVYGDDKKHEPFNDWVNSLKDHKAKAAIFTRLKRLKAGNFGDFKAFDGVYELRIDHGPGYRVYCARVGKQVILLLGGGDKKSQDNDIKKCISYLNDFNRRKS